jgi:hypothetical protein
MPIDDTEDEFEDEDDDVEDEDDDEEELPPTTYYVLDSTADDEADITRGPRLKGPLDNWMGGERWAVDVPSNLVFQIEEDDEGVMLPFFNDVVPLMRVDLLKALREAGVDNIDDYPAIIRETRSGREYRDYRVVNIIGAVRAADLAASDVEPSGFDGSFDIDAFFNTLKLDESAAQGLLLFRLAESVGTILVHAKVREHVEKSGIEHMEFVHPAEWSG